MVDVHEHGNPTEERSFGATFLFPTFFPSRVSSAPFPLFPRVILAPVLNRAYSWSTTFFSVFHLILAQPIASRSRNGKGVRHEDERLSKSPRLHTRGRSNFAALRFVYDYLRPRFTHLKLGAHFLDLCSLLVETCSQLRNRCAEVFL